MSGGRREEAVSKSVEWPVVLESWWRPWNGRKRYSFGVWLRYLYIFLKMFLIWAQCFDFQLVEIKQNLFKENRNNFFFIIAKNLANLKNSFAELVFLFLCPNLKYKKKIHWIFLSVWIKVSKNVNFAIFFNFVLKINTFWQSKYCLNVHWAGFPLLQKLWP